MKTKKILRKELDRRVAGISLGSSGGKAPAMCHLIYEVWWTDGYHTFERGSTLFGSFFQIDPKTGKVPKNNRGDLYAAMQAAALLVDQLQWACADLDGVKL